MTQRRLRITRTERRLTVSRRNDGSTDPSMLSSATVALKRFRSALADCQQAVSLQAASPQAKTLARLARCQIALGQIDAAERTLDECLQLDAKSGQAVADKAKVAKIKHDIANVAREREKKEWTYVLYGLDSLEREVDTLPSEWRFWRIEALLGRKRLDDAASLASDLLRLNSADPDALYIRGLVLFAQGNTAQAVAHAQQALRNDPDHKEAK